MEVPSLGIKLELQLQAYATATKTPYPSHICDFHPSLQQGRILNPLSQAGNQTLIFTNTMSASWQAEPQWELPFLIFLNGFLKIKRILFHDMWKLFEI